MDNIYIDCNSEKGRLLIEIVKKSEKTEDEEQSSFFIYDIIFIVGDNIGNS